MRQIKALEARRESLVAALEEYRVRDDAPLVSNKAPEKQLCERLSRFQELLSSNSEKDRQAFRKLLDGPIRFLTKAGGSYVLEARTKLGALLPPASTLVASPRGVDLIPQLYISSRLSTFCSLSRGYDSSRSRPTFWGELPTT